MTSRPICCRPVPANPDSSCQTTISQGGRAADQVRTRISWFNPRDFVNLPDGSGFGDAPRNNVIGPVLKEFDLLLFKEIGLHGENQKLQTSSGALISANAFGNEPPRQIQLGVRYTF